MPYIISHTVILHWMSINSNNTQISLLKTQLRKDLQRVSLFKLHCLFRHSIYIQVLMKILSINNTYNSQSGFNSFHISLEDLTSITDLIRACHFSSQICWTFSDI